MSTIAKTLAERIAEWGIRMEAEYADSNPNMVDSASMAFHYRCILRRGRKQLTTPFSQGSAHTSPPTTADVLDCLASDAAGYENAQSFEDWCGEYGFDTDSRKAERTYNTVKRQADKLRTFMGDDYEALLYHTERE
jgi:hypothetical protein